MLKLIVFLFLGVSIPLAVGAIAYVVIDWLVERHEEKRGYARGKKTSAAAGALFGIGALSVLGHLLLARRINKMSDTLEERRKWK